MLLSVTKHFELIRKRKILSPLSWLKLIKIFHLKLILDFQSLKGDTTKIWFLKNNVIVVQNKTWKKTDGCMGLNPQAENHRFGPSYIVFQSLMFCFEKFF